MSDAFISTPMLFPLVVVPPQGGYVAKQCPKRASNDHDPFYNDDLKEGDSDEAIARMQGGIDFEDVVGDAWRAAAPEGIFFSVPTCDRTVESKKKREEITLGLLENPGDVRIIWNARIPAVLEESRIAEPDALMRVGDTPKADGKWAWTSVDVKHHKVMEGTAKAKTWLVSTLANPLFEDATLTDVGPGKPQFKDTEQLCHYRRVLEWYGFGMEEGTKTLAGIIGKSLDIVWRDLDEPVKSVVKDGERIQLSAQDVYDEAFALRIKIIERARQRAVDPSLPALVDPEWSSECGECPWRTVCHDELSLDLDHITLLQGITPARAKAHYAVGVKSAGELAALDVKTAEAVNLGLETQVLRRLAKSEDPTKPFSTLLPSRTSSKLLDACTEAGLLTVKDAQDFQTGTGKYDGSKVWNLPSSIDQARTVKMGQVLLKRGVKALNVPRATIEEDIDIEDADGIVYMIGVRVTGRRKRGEDMKMRSEYYCFSDYSGTEDGEARVFAEWWSHMLSQKAWAKKNRWSRKMYCYSSKEPSTFKMLAAKHAGKEGIPTLSELNEVFDSKDWIDLYALLCEQTLWPTETMSIKYVAKYAGFSWRDENPSGLGSIEWYREAVSNPDVDVREANRSRVTLYNADDVAAQTAIREYLQGLIDTDNPAKSLPSASSLDSRFSRARRN